MNKTYFKKVYKNQPWKAKQGTVYVDPDLAQQCITVVSSKLETKINNCLTQGQEPTILVINALSGTLALAAREKYPKTRIICCEYFPFEILHLQQLGFEVVDLEMNEDNLTLEYMNTKLKKIINRSGIACGLQNPPWNQPNVAGRSAGELDQTFYRNMRKLVPLGASIMRSNFLKEDGGFGVEIRSDNTIFTMKDTTDFFDVESFSLCIFFDDSTNTELVQIESNTSTFKANRNEIVSVRVTENEHNLLLDALKRAKTQNLGDRFYRPGADQYVAGKLTETGSVQVIKNVGSSSTPHPVIRFSNETKQQPHIDLWRVVINAPGASDGIGCTPKLCPPGVFLSQSVVGFWAASKDEANKIIELLMSPTTSLIMKLIRQGNYNSKAIFRFIPL
jgi:hypothetical protein